MITTGGFRGALSNIVPNWLSNRLGKNVGFTVLWVIALMCDILTEVSLEGVRAPWPGIGTPTALPYIGQSRGLMQGPAESDATFISRLQAWLSTWESAGSAEGLALQIQAFLGTAPTVRIVDRSGNWVTAHADGSTTKTVDTNWDWDSISNPERADWWSDIWIIVYPSPWAVYTDLSDSAWIAAWGTSGGFGTGHKVTRDYVDGINQIVNTWKGAHTFVEAIIWDNSGVLFVPGALGLPGNPDGTWGNWGYSTSRPGLQSPVRTSNAFTFPIRYWTPMNGG